MTNAPSGHCRSVLVLDDEPNVLAAVNRVLRRSGHDIVTALTGKEALGLLAQREFAVIVSDQRMPEMTGVEFLAQAKKLAPRTVRILLTAYSDMDALRAAVNEGAIFRFVPKPWEPAALVAHVHEAMEHYRLQTEKEWLLSEIQTANEQLRAVQQDLRNTVHEKSEALLYATHYDALTGLPNRALVMDRLAQVLARAQRDQSKIALLALDLDRFGTINQTLGTTGGDQVLREVAQRLRGCIRAGDTVAREGNDEFVVIATALENQEQVHHLIKRARHALNAPINVGGVEIFATASVGVCLYPDDDTAPATLLSKSQVAMGHAKRAGGDGFQFYAQKMNQRLLKTLDLEAGLHRALEREEFRLHYQPQVDLRSGRVVGVEALLRWQRSDTALISPGEFIPVLEDTGLIEQVGDWILRQAVAQSRTWRDAGLPALRIGVNLSARQFRGSELAERIHAISLADGDDNIARYLELEITESVVMRDIENTIALLNHLHEQGFKLAIDDFGTGYASMSYLTRFPVDTLKIDMSFIQRIDRGERDAAVVQAMVAMGHSLGMRVIAEGVETRQQLDFLRACDCDEIQGYLFSKPLRATELEALLRANKSLD